MLSKGFLPATLPADPMPLFEEWFAGARKAKAQPNPDSMSLATSTPDGRPSVRVVLCRKLIASPGYVVFFTNYDSRKGAELGGQPARRRRLPLGRVRAPGAPRGSDRALARH